VKPGRMLNRLQDLDTAAFRHLINANIRIIIEKASILIRYFR
jgi:hypothetical protein